jgi:prepilin-type N-terminal cleavage/methylation domain-containing protein
MTKLVNGSTARKTAGFTLLEILLVVAAIGILAGIVIVAVNPGKQLGDTKNAQRRSDVNSILNGIYQYALDNNGSFPSEVPTTTARILGTATTGCNGICTATTTASSCADLSSTLVPTYIVGIPIDPATGTAANTDYYIRQLSTGRIEVGACDPEQGQTISVTR